MNQTKQAFNVVVNAAFSSHGTKAYHDTVARALQVLSDALSKLESIESRDAKKSDDSEKSRNETSK